VGSKENFALLHELAQVLGGELAHRALPLTLALPSMPARLVKPALPFVLSYTSLAVSQDKSSTPQVWSNRL